MVEKTVILDTVVTTVPDQETFVPFWDKVREAGIMGLGYGVVKSDDYLYVVSPELSSGDGEPGAFETLKQLVDLDNGRSGNGVVGYTSVVDPRFSNQNNGVWEITLILLYNPSAPSLYIALGKETYHLTVHNVSGLEVWENLKESLEYNKTHGIRDGNFYFEDSRLSEFVDTSIRNIYVLKRVNTHWQAINKRVVMTDR